MTEQQAPPRRPTGATVAAWVVLWLVLLDVAVNLLLGSGTASAERSGLKRYFEYGRSVEGKLERMVAADPQAGGQMIRAGWTSPDVLRSLPAQKAPGHDLLMAVYGQSFALQAADAVATQDGKITVRAVGGPGAPVSHSYASYKEDVALRRADVVVLGVLSSTVPNLGSLSGLIWMFENPAPFTFPRYRVVDGALTEELPVLRSEAQFRDAFTRNSPEWQRFKAQLRRSDRGYDRATFDASPADASAIVRLLRRGWVAHRQAYDEGVYTPGVGFDAEAEDVRALKALIVDMQRRTQANGERLIVLLLHTRGQADHLHATLAGTLQGAGIEYVSTHTLFSANDPANFVTDGHYTARANQRLADALHAMIRRPTDARPAFPPPNGAAPGMALR